MSLHHVAMTGRATIHHRGLKMTDQIIVLLLRMTDPGTLRLPGIMKKDQALLQVREIMTQVEVMTGLAILRHKGTTTRAGAMTDLAILHHKEVNHLPVIEAQLRQAEIQVHLQVEVEAEPAAVHEPPREAKRDFFQTEFV